jgi:hypothetical protein
LTAIALPAFAFLHAALAQVGPRREAVCLIALAGITALMSTQLFERMSIAPGIVVASALLLCAAFRIGYPRLPIAGRVTFGSLVIGWLGAVACALY